MKQHTALPLDDKMTAPLANQPLRVLMVLHMPWDRSLGAPSVQIELAEEFRARGHAVEKFSLEDAFPDGGPSPAQRAVGGGFAARAGAFVRSSGQRFDVIDAQHGNLPYRKESLGFHGALVARSSGLYRFYRDFEHYRRRRWPDESSGLRGQAFWRWVGWREERRQRRSLEVADLINVINRDELAFVRDRLGLGDRAVLIPNGMREERFAEFDAAAKPASDRLREPRIAFIGSWGPRKGSRDWRAIAERIRQALPRARFSFLGTAFTEAEILADVGLPAGNGTRVLPFYDPADLPALLADATVGVFPSYVEGFGLGVLEKLAAGLPVVAYDSPGPRQMLLDIDPTLLVPRGDPVRMAARVIDLLAMPTNAYADLSERCRTHARQYSSQRLADVTLDAYRQRLDQRVH